MLIGYDDDLAGEVTRIANRIHRLLTQIHPPLERVLGPKVQHPAVLEALSRCGDPTGMRKAGRSKLTEIVKARAPRMGTRLVEQIFTALDAQTVVVPDTAAAETILPRLAEALRDLLRQRDQVAAQIEGMLDAHPLSRVLTSMPGIGVRTAARILLEVGDGSDRVQDRHVWRLDRTRCCSPRHRHRTVGPAGGLNLRIVCTTNKQ